MKIIKLVRVYIKSYFLLFKKALQILILMEKALRNFFFATF